MGGSGGAAKARIFATADEGDTWAEILAPTVFSNNVARSSDAGKTWQLTTPTPFPGAI
jgi:hypothetical protein